MTKPSLLITRRLTDAVQARAARDYDVVLNEDDHVFSRDELVGRCQSVDAVLPCHSEIFDAGVIAALPDRMRIIANHSVGVDHVDLTAAAERGVTVTNTPDVLSDATAEIAMLCMLSAARRGAEGHNIVRDGRWDFWSPAFMVGRQVTAKRFGVVGMGRVGQVTARRARGFDMEIHYHARRRLDDAASGGAVFHDTLESLLGACEVISLHCPATPATTGMMDADAFSMMRPGSIFVNTARGALVDEDALVDALERGPLFAAGLDVFRTEPGGNPRLAALPNVFLMPHVGSATDETRDAMGFRALDNLDAFFAGRAPGDRVA
ncbi:MAG: D-glycerate dehydrogenase [Pseudomonadota bacterium]